MMKKWTLLLALTAAVQAAVAVSPEDLAGYWQMWRTEGDAQIELGSVLYRFNADGTWAFAWPERQAPGGKFSIADDNRVTLYLIHEDEVVETTELQVTDAGRLRGGTETLEVEFYPHPANRGELIAELPGEWLVRFKADDGQEHDAPFLFVFGAGGNWKSQAVPAADDAKTGAETELEELVEEDGKYTVDDAGFLIVGNASGGRAVFTYADGRLTGWDELASIYCVKR